MGYTFSWKYGFLLLILYACQPKVNNLNISTKGLELKEGIMLYNKVTYTGILSATTNTITSYSVSYIKGLKHGKEEKFFHNGDLAVQRFYNHGKKSGTHKVWWDKNQLKLVNHFDNAGNLIGTQQEWYSNGQLSKEFNFTKGKEDGTQKIWDVHGKVLANYTVINGERFGLIPFKNCKLSDYVY